MLCPHCGVDNTSAFGYCQSCGKPLSTVHGAPAAAPGFAVAPAPVRTRRATSAVIAAVSVVVLLIVAAAFVLGSGNVSLRPESAEQHIGRLMREAAGVQPVRNSLFPSRRKLDDAVRDQFRNLVRQNREYSTAVHNADVSQVKFINTPESFTNPELAAGGLAQLHSICDMDADQEEKVQEIIGNLRRTVESTAGSGEERDALIKGMDEGMAAPMAKRQALIAAEKAWRQAVDDEYAFAARYSSSFRLLQGHLVIDDPALREDFNTRVSFQETQRKQFLAMEKEFRQFQGQLLQKMGVNPGDLGVAK